MKRIVQNNFAIQHGYTWEIPMLSPAIYIIVWTLLSVVLYMYVCANRHVSYVLRLATEEKKREVTERYILHEGSSTFVMTLQCDLWNISNCKEVELINFFRQVRANIYHQTSRRLVNIFSLCLLHV